MEVLYLAWFLFVYLGECCDVLELDGDLRKFSGISGNENRPNFSRQQHDWSGIVCFSVSEIKKYILIKRSIDFGIRDKRNSPSGSERSTGILGGAKLTLEIFSIQHEASEIFLCTLAIMRDVTGLKTGSNSLKSKIVTIIMHQLIDTDKVPPLNDWQGLESLCS